MDTQPTGEPQSPLDPVPDAAPGVSGGVWPPVPKVDPQLTAQADAQREHDRLVGIAVAQRHVLWAVLAGIVALLLVGAIHMIAVAGIVLVYAIAIYQIVAIYRLARALNSSLAILYAVLCLIPCISLLTLLMVNQSATRELTKGGVKVGLLGAKPNSIP